MFDAAEISSAASLVDEFETALGAPAGADRMLIQKIRERAQLLSWAKQPPLVRTLPAVERRVVNLLAYSLPYSSVGYATRSHGLAQAVQRAGWEILPHTRPGFPLDQMPELQGRTLPAEDVIDGVRYHRLFDCARRQTTELGYLNAAIASYARVFESLSPAVVHAASNHTTGLPALIAARRSGIPFVYEMRGFWEVTRSSSDPEFIRTRTYRLIRLFETVVAQAADHVITLTEGMRKNLADRGVPVDRISVVPNGVDAERFVPRERDRELELRLGLSMDEPVIGYVGSMVEYEGLDDLVEAAAVLAARGRRFRLLLVGDGLSAPDLRARVDAAGLTHRTVLTGRVPHEDVTRYYSLIDVCAFPRKPWEVCELVSPLKPYEAMAQEKAVVVSGTAALARIVSDGETGLVFEAGSVPALVEALERALGDAGLRQRLGGAARRWILAGRTWRSAGEACVGVYRRVTAADGAVRRDGA
ncbi:MAG: glycosyltransferase [Steroidobacteraceae bacterium]